MRIRVTRATPRKSLPSLLIEVTSISQWGAVRPNFFQRPKAAIDKITATSYWSFAATGSMWFEHERNWRVFQHGGGQSFSAFLVVTTSHLRIKWKRELRSRVCRT